MEAVKSTCTGQATTLPKGGDCQFHLHRPSPHLAHGWRLSNLLARAKPPPCPRVGTVKSTCTGQAPTLPKGGDCQIHLHRPSPHLAQGWGLSTPLAQTKPPPCRRDCPFHLHKPSPHLAQGWGLSNPLAHTKPQPCRRVGTVKSTCTDQAPILPKHGDCQIHLRRPSPHLAQGWDLSNPLAWATPPPCQRVGTVISTCTGQDPTLPMGGGCQIYLHRPSPHLAQGWGMSNPLAQAKPPPCPMVGTVKSTCTRQAPILPKGGDCQIHLHRPTPHLAQGWGLPSPLAQGKPPHCPRVGTVKSTCTDQAPTLPKGGKCQIHLHKPSPHLAQGWGLSNPMAQTKPPPCPRVGTVKSTCTGEAPTQPKGRDCQIHLHKPSPHLAQGWGLSNPLAQAKPPSCPRVGTIKSTCTGQAPILPKGGTCQIHLHTPSPHVAQGWGLSNPLAHTKPHLAQGWGLSIPLAQTKPPPCPWVATVNSTCTSQAPILPKGGDCQIYLHRPSPRLAQGWELSNPLAHTKPQPCKTPTCLRVGIVKSTCTDQAPILPKGGDCQIHLHGPSPHHAHGWRLSNPLAQAKTPPCPMGGNCRIHLHMPSPHVAQGWELSNPLAQAKPPPCPRVATVKSTCTGQAPTLPKGGDCEIHLHRPSVHLAQGWEVSNPLARAKPPPCPKVGTVKSTCTGQAPTLPKGANF